MTHTCVNIRIAVNCVRLDDEDQARILASVVLARWSSGTKPTSVQAVWVQYGGVNDVEDGLEDTGVDGVDDTTLPPILGPKG